MSVELVRAVPSWHARADGWRAMPLRMWGPVVADARWLWSLDVLELVAGHVGAPVADVAERVLGMRVQQRYLVLGTIARTQRCTILGAVDQLLARSVALKIPHERDDEATWKLVAEVQAMMCLTGEHPFGDPPATADSSAATMVLIERAREGQVREPDTDVPGSMLTALRMALRAEPEQRPTLDVLLDRLAALHPDATRIRPPWWTRLTSVRERSMSRGASP